MTVDCKELEETCENQPHENISQEGVVDDVPEPVEVGENVVHHIWAGLDKVTHPGQELSF